jgi:hypothetical protein
VDHAVRQRRGTPEQSIEIGSGPAEEAGRFRCMEGRLCARLGDRSSASHANDTVPKVFRPFRLTDDRGQSLTYLRRSLASTSWRVLVSIAALPRLSCRTMVAMPAVEGGR